MLVEIESKKYLNKGAFSMKSGKNDCSWLLHVFPENLTFRSYHQGIIRATENLQFKIFVYTRKWYCSYWNTLLIGYKSLYQITLREIIGWFFVTEATHVW